MGLNGMLTTFLVPVLSASRQRPQLLNISKIHCRFEAEPGCWTMFVASLQPRMSAHRAALFV
jgi:hypothetical protein